VGSVSCWLPYEEDVVGRSARRGLVEEAILDEQAAWTLCILDWL